MPQKRKVTKSLKSCGSTKKRVHPKQMSQVNWTLRERSQQEAILDGL